MNKLLILKDEDIFPNITTPSRADFLSRIAVKVVLFDSEDKLALVGTKYRLLPGGGVEERESIEDAALRESIEEVGCNIQIIRKIATTEEFREKIRRRQETYFLLARVIGEKGFPQTTQNDEQGIVVEWQSLHEAIALLEKQKQEIPFGSYHSCFNVRTHLAVLKELQNSDI